MRVLAAAAATAVLLQTACLEREKIGDIGEPNLATVQVRIFTPRCTDADCHSGSDPKKGLNLEPGKAVDSLVGVLAEHAPLYRVLPGDAEASYLIHKLRGTMGDVGGDGDRMPLDATPLSNVEIQLVADWIDNLAVELPPPVIASVTPAAASAGSLVLITGEDFGLEQGEGFVTIGGEAAPVSAWNATAIEATVPDGSAPGSAPIVVTAADQASDPFPFEVLAEAVPSVIGVSPNLSAVGATVEVRGSNFGDERADSFVRFDAVTAINYPSWSDTSIEVVVPTGATSSSVSVTVGGVDSNSVPIRIVEPTLSSIQENVFSRRCTLVCHNDSSQDPDPVTDCPPEATTGALDLREGFAHVELVGIDSCMFPGTARITPFNRSTSLLFLKIAFASPPAGERMPLDAIPLSPEVVEVIGAWIDSGAPNN